MKQIFEWDGKKAQTNLSKHKVSFDEGQTIFDDPFLLTYKDEMHSEQEDRFISMGMSKNERILLVVHVERLETEELVVIRLISCRKATAAERRFYEENK